MKVTSRLGLIGIYLLTALTATPGVYAQRFDGDVPILVPPAPPPPPPAPPTPPPPPPVQPPAPPQVSVPATVNPPFVPPILPTDVTGAAAKLPAQPGQLPSVAVGMTILSENKFPLPEKFNGRSDGIVVRSDIETIMERPSPCAVKLHTGRILVSVRKPSDLGLITTSLGEIALSSDSDVLVTYQDGVVRIMNLTATGTACKVRFDTGVISESQAKVVSIRPGFELVFSKTQLKPNDVRPADGIARRRFKVFEQGRLALGEFSVESSIKSCDLIASLEQQQGDRKAQRIMTDMSKMAAVLNYVNGGGYATATVESRLATTNPSTVSP